ncbi:type VII secretion integral membrane protein EccD [Kribbella sindirgiensis]|uniref:Type VII secretion integral membrane protein EccD n=1 Tax=Kribbella sindirgiensis TaxID=1124744 RepID=A0A4R0I556_9ACTN|nr:type VII secretion integral membrane protein EccD [Kribbella sindirgiensis]TCC22338.1 type VII secretion integral membrane protein EccD [Kribbella sindirgiensis]
MNITGLVRVTVATPQRRLDLALPEQSSVAEILPGLLAKAGEHLADDGVPDGGWVLRRFDGAGLTLGRSLGSHRIKDGEILYLVRREIDWPELEYDDLVDAVARGSGRLGSAWSAWHTRAAGLLVASIGVSIAGVTMLRPGAPWSEPAGQLLLLTLLLVAAAIVLARVVGDAGAGAIIGGQAIVSAACGGGLLFAGDHASPAIGAPQVLAGSAAVLLAAVACYVGVVDGASFFAAAICAGVLGAIGGWIGTAGSPDAADVSAIVGSAAFGLSPLLAPLAIRIGRLPMPVLPRTTADLVRDDPLPPRHQVYGAVVRADGLVTGMLGGLMMTESVCLIYLLRSDSRAATILAALLTVGCLIRSRLYPVVKQRLMLLTPGLVGAAGLVLYPLSREYSDPMTVVVPLVIVTAAAAVFLGLRYSTRTPSPYISRYAEIVEVLLMLALIPVACAVLGLYGVVRGLGG